jgi:hypothetical protein
MTMQELIEKIRRGNTGESDAQWLEQWVAMQSVQRVCESMDDWDLRQQEKLREIVATLKG